jgi:type III pantothenate kinase
MSTSGVLLTLDIGNSATKAGWFRDGELLSSERFEGHEPDALSNWLVTLRDLAPATPERVALVSVVPALTERVRDALHGVPLLLAGTPSLKLSVRVHDEVHGLGNDRLLAAEAAFAHAKGAALAITAGTATTFTAVDANGIVLGGAIAPGLQIGANALFAAGAQLFSVELRAPERVLARNTTEAMQAGVVLGHAALIDGLLDRFERELGTLAVIGTGGWMGLLTPLLRHAVVVDPHLILRGLAQAAVSSRT